MPTDPFTSSSLIVFKVLTIILILLHVLFSLVVVKQTKLMIGVVEAKISSVIYTISIIHFIASLFVLIFAIIFL